MARVYPRIAVVDINTQKHPRIGRIMVTFPLFAAATAAAALPSSSATLFLPKLEAKL